MNIAVSRLVLGLLLACSGELQAGWLMSGSLGVDHFSFRPVDKEVTYNYKGFSPNIMLGYSIRQAFDITGYGLYVPGNRVLRIHRQTAGFYSYGGQIKARMLGAVFFALRGGQATYNLFYPQNIDDEVVGKWTGPAGGGIIGLIYKLDKDTFVELGFEIMHARLKNGGATRKFDRFSISVSYTFNGFINLIFRSALLKSLTK